MIICSTMLHSAVFHFGHLSRQIVCHEIHLTFFSFEFDTNKNHEICNKSKIMADRDRKWMYLLQWMERRRNCAERTMKQVAAESLHMLSNRVKMHHCQSTSRRQLSLVIINNSSEFSAFSAPQHPSAWCIFHNSQFSLLLSCFLFVVKCARLDISPSTWSLVHENKILGAPDIMVGMGEWVFFYVFSCRFVDNGEMPPHDAHIVRRAAVAIGRGNVEKKFRARASSARDNKSKCVMAGEQCTSR